MWRLRRRMRNLKGRKKPTDGREMPKLDAREISTVTDALSSTLVAGLGATFPEGQIAEAANFFALLPRTDSRLIAPTEREDAVLHAVLEREALREQVEGILGGRIRHEAGLSGAPLATAARLRS